MKKTIVLCDRCGKECKKRTPIIDIGYDEKHLNVQTIIQFNSIPPPSNSNEVDLCNDCLKVYAQILLKELNK